MFPIFLGQWDNKKNKDFITNEFQIPWYYIQDYDVVIALFDNTFTVGTCFLLLEKDDKLFQILFQDSSIYYGPFKTQWQPTEITLDDLKKLLDSDMCLVYNQVKSLIEKFIEQKEGKNG